MADFIVLDRRFLRRIVADTRRTPSRYHHPFAPLRMIFWQRLKVLFRMVKKHALGRRRCLDFCGGGGVFLPSLAQLFAQVDCVDLELSEAEQVVEHYGLKNVRLLSLESAAADLGEGSYDLIVAADVLEHFADLSMPVSALKTWLAVDGVLLTSLPSESWLYGQLRKVFAVTPPADHYHRACDVEAFLAEQGFRKCQRRFVPFHCKPLALFHVTCWRQQ